MAERCYIKALDIKIKYLGEEHVEIAREYENMAEFYTD